MKIVSIGDLVCDYYYKDSKLIGIDGGMSSHNIIFNLASKGLDTKVYGVCGNDIQGIICIDSLKRNNVDTTDIIIDNNINTRCFHINLELDSKKRCPFCNNKKWYIDSMIYEKDIINKLNIDDILVFDNLNNKNQFIIDNTKNIKLLDLGQYKEFEDLNNNLIIKKIYNKFKIVNLNEIVYLFLKERFNLDNEMQLYNLFKSDLITVTKGNKGSTFIYKDQIYNFYLGKDNNVIDTTGCSDRFFSVIIYYYIKNNLSFNNIDFNELYKKILKETYKQASFIGSREKKYGLYTIKKINNLCTCNSFDV